MFDVGVSVYLPMSVFPGIYAPQLAELLNGQGKQTELNEGSGKAIDILFITRSQQRQQEKSGEGLILGLTQWIRGKRRLKRPILASRMIEDTFEIEDKAIGADSRDDLFTGGRVRERMTRSQKWKHKCRYGSTFHGHMGRTKISWRIIQRFYWSTSKKDVSDHCWSCSECLRIFSTSRPSKPPLPLPNRTS